MLAPVLLALALAQTEATPAAPPAPPAPEGAPAPAPPARAPEAPPAPQAKPAPPPRPPRPPAPRAEADAPREEPVLRGFDRPSGKRFTGDFDDEEIDDALRQIAEAADWSIVLPPGRHGTISARFKNVPVEDALRAVLNQASLSATREGSVITVRPRAAVGSLRLPGLSIDIQRRTEEAMRRAQREMERAEREMERAERRRERSESDRVVHGDVVVHPDQVARDVVALRGSIKVESGAEVRDAVAVLGSVTLEPGARAREAVAVGGDVKLGAGAEVEKDAVSVGGSVTRDAGAEIGGEEVSVGVPVLSGLATLAGSRILFGGKGESPGFVVGQTLAKFLVYFALGLLALALFPRRVDAVSASFVTHPLKSVLTGLLGIVVLPILLVLLVATIIGIPLVAVLGLMIVAAGVLGFTALAYYIGRALPLQLRRGTSVLQLAVGTAIVVLVTAIPFLGGMAWVAAALLTFGAVLRSRFGSQTPVLPTTPIPPSEPPPAPAA
ncbi:MAG TPA: secretin and TonB N-terminal domain-containing protein [Anaeromyxobacter sp.]|nr:secretin and TonB N-terminal domain-containing protein [Anaeromyxobacter sp.]